MYMQLAIRRSVVLGIFILCITCISTSCSLHLRGGLRAFAKIERYVYGITLLHTYLLPLNSSRGKKIIVEAVELTKPQRRGGLLLLRSFRKGSKIGSME